MDMKFIVILLVSWLGAICGIAVAVEETKPPLPDPEYCARRDADPEKCVIQDGPPPNKPIVRKQAKPK